MFIIFLNFANNSKNYLTSLRKEDNQINNLLNGRKIKGDFIVHSEQFATTEKIINNLRQFKENIEVFLYSGHAERDSLALEDTQAHAEGIAELLGRCPNLKLVILNGCSTYGQVATLLEKNIPIVIATSSPVEDERATQFSITFFEELAVKNSSIQIAYKEAVAAAKVKGIIIEKINNRSVILRSKADANQPLWGLYYQDKNAELIHTWRLPQKPIVNTSNQYIQNAIEGIYEKFATTFSAQNEDTRHQDVILKRLPYSISEPIRKLLAPNDQSGQLFYDQPSPARFQMLIYAYRSMLAFVTYVLLAQLWEQKRNSKNTLSTINLATILKVWLNRDYKKDNTLSPLLFLQQLFTFFKTNQLSFFIEELDIAIEELSSDVDIQESIDFLEQQIVQNPQANLAYLCDATEQHLAIILYHFGFLIHYGLTSVKDINVLFYQHNIEPDFEHKIVKLQQALTNLEDRKEREKNYYKTATILLRRLDDKSKYLYLSPFLIDENAYTNTPKAKLCAFIAYNPKNNGFLFRHVSKPSDLITIEKKHVSPLAKIKQRKETQEDYYPLINGQFSAFCQAVLGKTLETL